jgi:hypothetical protein
MDTDTLSQLITFAYGLFFITCFVIVIALVFKRIKEKKTEDFEQRDN